MRKNLLFWQFAGFVIATALGTLLHFIYEWTGWLIFAPISAVNESTFEHMKILFFPMLFFALFQSFYFQNQKGFWWIKCIGILTAVLSIPVFFYTYQGSFGKPPAWLNILFFFLSAFIGYALEYFLFQKTNIGQSWDIPAYIILGITTVLFVAFTFYPPKLPLFLDPLTKTYGVV